MENKYFSSTFISIIFVIIALYMWVVSVLRMQPILTDSWKKNYIFLELLEVLCGFRF